MVGRKPTRDKDNIARRLVIDISEEPVGVEEIRNNSSDRLGAMAQEWVGQIDFIRSKCGTMNGTLSNRIKTRTLALGEFIRVMAERLQDFGDPGFLKRQNEELAAKVSSYEKEVASLKTEVKDLTETEFQSKFETAEKARMYLLMTKTMTDRGTSPMPQIVESTAPLNAELSLDVGGMKNLVNEISRAEKMRSSPDTKEKDNNMDCDLLLRMLGARSPLPSLDRCRG